MKRSRRAEALAALFATLFLVAPFAQDNPSEPAVEPETPAVETADPGLPDAGELVDSALPDPTGDETPAEGEATAEDELLAAVAKIAELEGDRDRIAGELLDATSELLTTTAANEALKERIAELEGRIAELEAAPAPGTGEAGTAADDRITELEAELDSLAAETETLRSENDGLLERGNGLEADLAKLEAEKKGLEAKVTDLEGIVAQLEESARETEAELAAERRDLPARVAAGSWDFDRSVFGAPDQAGFSGAVPATGAWTVKNGDAWQTDASQYFAKLRMNVSQTRSPTLYSFKAVSTGKGWVGLGIHFFASEAMKRRSYGEGKSLLVWMTRDPEARGDGETYLQLYRSDDAVSMERVFDAEVQADIAKEHYFEILYDPVSGYVAVAIDGTVRAVYKTFFGIEEGATLALRTLGGGARFSDFTVRIAR
ncbi:MAG: hypothetical protein NT080_01340 [Spirochaetes bacterium]|nr:hypothetical protein [Spirochaetota bacterium]